MPRHAIRSALALALALVSVVAPRSAAAQALDEAQCRAKTGQHAACVGLMKLGERASAECRRTRLAEEEACWSRVGREVLRAEIAEHESSWLSRTLRFQHRLGNSLPLRNAPWIGTHNSFNDTAEDPTLSHTDSNQQLGLRDQLRLDVRSLELDVHWVPSARADDTFAPVVCHARGRDQAHAGCTTERLLSERISEVAAWVEENPGEVILLYVEDHLGDRDAYAAAAEALKTAFGERLYKPAQPRPAEPVCTNLPLELTRDEILASGAQVVVVGSCGTGEWRRLSFDWPSAVRFEGRPKGYGAFPGCGAPGADAADAKIVRYFEDSTFIAPALERTGFSSTDDGLTPATVREMVACGVDLFGFDQLLPSDGRLEALAWSWAPGEPAAPGCTLQRGDGRWESSSCTKRARPACRGGDGAWTVLPQAVTRRAAAAACAAAGLDLDTPRSGRENALLRARAGSAPVWLAHRSD